MLQSDLVCGATKRSKLFSILFLNCENWDIFTQTQDKWELNGTQTGNLCHAIDWRSQIQLLHHSAASTASSSFWSAKTMKKIVNGVI